MPAASLNAIVADNKEGGFKSKGSIKDKEEMNPGKSITGAPLFQYWFVGYQWEMVSKHMFGREWITHSVTPK